MMEVSIMGKVKETEQSKRAKTGKKTENKTYITRRERIDNITGKKEYKARYFFMANGEKHEAETGWFPTKSQAQKEAKALKEAKERADASAILSRRDKMLKTVFGEFIEYLGAEAKKEDTISYVTYYKGAKTILKTYMPTTVQETKVKDISPSIFKGWINYVNDQDKLGGERVRSYCLIIRKFNDWLDKNFYYTDEDLCVQNSLHMERVKLKPVKAHNKEEEHKRRVLSLMQFMELGQYYANLGLDKFENFYWFSLFHVLFFSGIRVEELVGLQWKFVNISSKTIFILNSITEHESEEHAISRVNTGNYKLKNKTSKRAIQIFDYYYPVLIEYRKSFQIEFGLSWEELQQAFVFPNLAKHNPNIYQSHKTIVRHLQNACRSAGLPRTDSQMMRHSCCTFLVSPPPEGMGLKADEVKAHFGHKDSKMVQDIYGKLDIFAELAKSAEVFEKAGIYTSPSKTAMQIEQEKKKQEVMDMITNKNKEVVLSAKRVRLFWEIEVAIRRGDTEFPYFPEDTALIEEYKAKEPDTTIIFVEVTEDTKED